MGIFSSGSFRALRIWLRKTSTDPRRSVRRSRGSSEAFPQEASFSGLPGISSSTPPWKLGNPPGSSMIPPFHQQHESGIKEKRWLWIVSLSCWSDPTSHREFALWQVEWVQSEGEGKKKEGEKEEENFEEFNLFMVVVSLLVGLIFVMTLVFPMDVEGWSRWSKSCSRFANARRGWPKSPCWSSAAPESTSSSKDPLGVQRAIQEIVKEEANLWARIRADPSCFANEYNTFDQVQLSSQVTTRYGSVYHGAPSCGYLTSPQTGTACESRWCHLCRYACMKARSSRDLE